MSNIREPRAQWRHAPGTCLLPDVIIEGAYLLSRIRWQDFRRKMVSLYVDSMSKIAFCPHQQLIDPEIAAQPSVSGIPGGLRTARINDYAGRVRAQSAYDGNRNIMDWIFMGSQMSC